MAAFYFSDHEIAKAVTDLSKEKLEELLEKFRTAWRAQLKEKTGLPSNVIKCHIGVPDFSSSDVCRNGEWENDVEGNEIQPRIPCCVFHQSKSNPNRGEYTWDPIIDPATGRILNWEHGVEASVQYKVCDECEFEYEVDGEVVADNFVECYVPGFLCPEEDGYGDYIIMHINADGQIEHWSKNEFNSWVKNHTTIKTNYLV